MSGGRPDWQTPADLFKVLDKGGIYQGMEFEGFNFDIDLCANEENSKCDIWYKDYLNNAIGNSISLYGEACSNVVNINELGKNAFMNPPYSNPKPFIEKAWEDSEHCKIVCLVKCDPSTKWWSVFWEYETTECKQCWGKGIVYYENTNAGLRSDIVNCPKCIGTGKQHYNGPKPGCEVRFFPKRIKFDPPKQLIENGNAQWIKGKWYVFNKVKNKMELLHGPTFSSALIIMDRRGM